MPTLLRVRGYRFFFFSMEGREPPHIHVAHAGRYGKFWLEPVTLAEVRGFRSHELTEIRRTEAVVVDVSCTADTLSVVVADGRTISVPLAWFPRLLEATEKQRAEWELIGGGIGIHWEAIDEDISLATFLQPESFTSLPNKRMQPAGRKRRTKVGRRVARG